MSYDELASRIKKLQKSGKLKAKDLAEWLRAKGVEVPSRPSIDRLLELARRSRKVKLKELEEFVASFEREEEEYEREIIIKEKGKRKAERAEVKAKRTRQVQATESVPLVDLIFELWKGMSPQDVLEQVTSILDEEGISYKKASSLTELVTSLPPKAQKILHDRLVQIKEWRRFQNQVKEWLSENVDFARRIIKAGGTLQVEKVITGHSGVTYRVDVYGEAVEKYFLGSSKLLLLVEVKRHSEPIKLDDVLVFMGKARDIAEAVKADEEFFAIFSSSGFTDRAITYVKSWKVGETPVYLYALEKGTFKRVA